MTDGRAPTPRDRSEEEAARLARQVTARAIRRLDVLEWVILAAAVVVALLGGGLIAALVGGSLGVGSRVVWAVASLLLFGVPAVVAVRRMREEERASRERLAPRQSPGGNEEDDDG